MNLPICKPANENLTVRQSLIRTSFYAANAFCVGSVVTALLAPPIIGAAAFAVTFWAFARLGERR